MPRGLETRDVFDHAQLERALLQPEVHGCWIAALTAGASVGFMDNEWHLHHAKATTPFKTRLCQRQTQADIK
jgi:hypothetical protein